MMAKYANYIGVTETADPGLHWETLKRLRRVNVIITKHLENPEFRKWLLENKEHIILHATVTGWGGTRVEPGVISYTESIDYINSLIEDGFPVKQIVLRVDPIIPDNEGIDRFIEVLSKSVEIKGLTRIRVSILDAYFHIRKKMQKLGIDLSLNYEGFTPKITAFKIVDAIIEKHKELRPTVVFEACAESELKSCEQVGCVSQKDVDILKMTDQVKLVGKSNQRGTCLCPANKIQLTGTYYDIAKQKCKSKCAYCYLKSNH